MQSCKDKTILIVDDNPQHTLNFQKILQQAQFKILTATNNEEALNLLKTHPIHLIISDVNFPNLDGYALCQHIKNNPTYCHIPLILCTVLSSAEDLMKGIEANADSYITRPYNKEHLLQLINDLLERPSRCPTQEKEEIVFGSKTYTISTSRQYILNFLLETYCNIHQQHKELMALREDLQEANRKLEISHHEQKQLLLNMLPESVANELIASGTVEPLRFEETSVIFIDFAGFSQSATILSPQNLIQALNYYFEKFDQIIEHFQIERIKTIGDGYMCVSGVPNEDPFHAQHCVAAALEIQKFMTDSLEFIYQKYGIRWQARIGIHSGPIVAGVIGKKRLAYDIWGETVNVASRMESHGLPGEVNISRATYDLIKESFTVEPRGKLPIHNRGIIEMHMEMFLVKK